MNIDLVRGQRSPFFDRLGPSFTVGVELKGVDPLCWRFLCLMVDERGKVASGSEVFYDPSQRSECGTITPKGQGQTAHFQVELARAPAGVTGLVFAVVFMTPPARGRTTANLVQQGLVKVKGQNGAEVRYPFQGGDFGQETAVLLLEIYRKDPWRLMAVGSGFLGGVGAMLSRYDVSNDVIRAIESGEVPLKQLTADSLFLPGGWPGGQVPKVPGGLLPAVGLVLVETADGGGTGTAFAISPGGFLLTCAHVVEGATKIGVVMDGNTMIRPAVPVLGDSNLDVALLYLPDRCGVERWFSLCSADAEVEIGQEVGILGYPLRGALGANVSYSHGIVNSVRRRHNGTGHVFQVDAGAAPGSSGAPVFSRTDGTVIGILSSGLENAPGMLINFAVDLRNVHRLGWFGG